MPDVANGAKGDGCVGWAMHFATWTPRIDSTAALVKKSNPTAWVISALKLLSAGMGSHMTDTNQEKEDEVLRRMLATKPKPHKSPKANKKAAKGD